jgi:hypothetical protein
MAKTKINNSGEIEAKIITLIKSEKELTAAKAKELLITNYPIEDEKTLYDKVLHVLNTLSRNDLITKVGNLFVSETNLSIAQLCKYDVQNTLTPLQTKVIEILVAVKKSVHVEIIINKFKIFNADIFKDLTTYDQEYNKIHRVLVQLETKSLVNKTALGSYSIPSRYSSTSLIKLFKDKPYINEQHMIDTLVKTNVLSIHELNNQLLELKKSKTIRKINNNTYRIVKN